MKKNAGKISVKEAQKALGELRMELSEEEVKEIVDAAWNMSQIYFKHFVKT